jgi:hypothetical protein
MVSDWEVTIGIPLADVRLRAIDRAKSFQIFSHLYFAHFLLCMETGIYLE